MKIPREKKSHRIGHIDWCAPASGRDLGTVVIFHFLQVVFVAFDRKPPGSDHIDRDSESRGLFNHAS